MMKQSLIARLFFIGTAIYSQFFCAPTLFTQTGAGRSKLQINDASRMRIDKRLMELTEKGFSGSVLVTRKGNIILHKGYGWSDNKHRYPITTGTKFCVASVSKQFTAAAILHLQE